MSNSINYTTIERMVEGFDEQDLNKIMPLFAEDATYHDMRGSQTMGTSYRGQTGIHDFFHRQFNYLMPKHHYIDPIIFGEGDYMCASWTLVLGSDRPAHKQYQIRGCDYFLLKHGKVVEKCAFLKTNSLATYCAIIRLRSWELLRKLLPGNKQQALA